MLPYGILQGYSVVIVLLLAMLSPSRYTRGNDLYWVFGWYVLSKLLETFDAQVLALGSVVSGHTLKHMAAAMAGVTVSYMLMHRTLEEPAASPKPSGNALSAAVLATAGLYERSGDWLYEIGLPGKSGVSGGIVTVSPGKGGLGTFSPLLDGAGNSIKGQRVTKYLSERLGLNLFASKPAV